MLNHSSDIPFVMDCTVNDECHILNLMNRMWNVNVMNVVQHRQQVQSVHASCDIDMVTVVLNHVVVSNCHFHRYHYPVQCQCLVKKALIQSTDEKRTTSMS